MTGNPINWSRAGKAGKRTLSTVDDNDRIGKDAAARWLAKNDKTTPSKDALRREADRLLADYTGPVTKVPAGVTVAGHSQVTGNVTSETGRPARQKPGRRDRRASVIRSQISTAVPPGLVIYCDGACEPNPGIGGWGFVVYRDGVEIHSDCGGANPATNNTMELTGALMALRWLDQHSEGATLLRPVSARLFCDSMYVVNGCNDWRHGWKRKGWLTAAKKPVKNAELWQALDEVLTLVPIKLEWVKGHAGIVGNELADELSLIGRERASEAPDAHTARDSDVRLAQIKQQLSLEGF